MLPRPDEDGVNFRIIGASIVLGIGLNIRVLNLGRFAYNLKNFGEWKKKKILSGFVLRRARYHVYLHE